MALVKKWEEQMRVRYINVRKEIYVSDKSFVIKSLEKCISHNHSNARGYLLLSVSQFIPHTLFFHFYTTRHFVLCSLPIQFIFILSCYNSQPLSLSLS